MRSFRKISLTSLFCLAAVTVARSQSPDDSFNFGTAKGTAFHVAIQFQLNDMKGQHAEQGSIDVNRSTGSTMHSVIEAPSLHLDSSASDAEYLQKFGRESFLVNLALRALTHPIDTFSPPDSTMKEQSTDIDGITLLCRWEVSQSDPSVTSEVYCFNPVGQLVLIRGGMGLQITRSNFKRYGDWQIAQHVEVSYGKAVSIVANLTKVEGSQENVPAVSNAEPNILPSSILRGRIVKKKEPKYPTLAKLSHIQGTVVLCGIIGTAGKLSRLEPIASPDKLLTDAAMDAVKKWEYQPYLLNGKPTDVETTIAVNFALNDGKK